MRKNRDREAFTLIELLVVIVIIGLLAGLVAPKFFGQLENAKIKTAGAQIEMISTALDTFRLDTNRYPTDSENLKVLWAKKSSSIRGFNGPYLPKPLKKDPWGYEYIYKEKGKDGNPYQLYSTGADGEVGGEGEDMDISIWDAD